MKTESIKRILTRNILSEIEGLHLNWDHIHEIRIRANQKLYLLYENNEIILKNKVTWKEVQEMLAYLSDYSLYAYEDEIRQGFITIEGGHRVGLAGQVVLEQGQVRNIKHISSLNIRVSHEVLYCSDHILPHITKGKQVCHTLIISPPRCGKTTLLRDIVRQISDGNRWVKSQDVAVVDERSEIAACYRGVPQNKVGTRTDVLDGCPKKEGMLMLIRSMAPQVIAVDEIGGLGDVETVKYAMRCGVKMLATVHGESMEEIRQKPLFDQLVRERYFERYVVLKNGVHIGQVAGIYDERGSLLYREGS